MHPFLNTAIKAARYASANMHRASQGLNRTTPQQKSRAELVANIIHLVEEEIAKILTAAYPDHEILFETQNQDVQLCLPTSSEYTWFIDALDCPESMLRGLAQHTISMVIATPQHIVHALVYSPQNDELFTASYGNGAYLNNQRLRVAQQNRLESALCSTTSLACKKKTVRTTEESERLLFRIGQRCMDIYHSGSVALNLAYVASGRFDIFIARHLPPVAIHAGRLLVTEAGGWASFDEDWQQDQAWMLAANPKLFTQMANVLKNCALNNTREAE